MSQQLTPAMRDWLDRETKPAKQQDGDIINAFIDQFAVSPRDAGRLMAMWIMEYRKS